MLAQPSLVEPPEIQSNVGSGLAVNSTSATSAVPARITDVPPLKLGGSAAYKPTSVDISPAGVSPAAAVPAVTAGSEVSPLVSPPATSKIKGANSRVEKSQGSLGVINSMLHSFTAGKAAKSVTAKKGSTLTDAQIADIRYTSKADFAGSALHILHRGAINIVYIATAQATGLKLLLKAYDISKMSDQELAAVRSEIDMLTRLKHEGVARCRGSWQDDKHLYSVEEYGVRGDLFIEMFSERQRLTERFIACKVLSPLLSALVYIHGCNIVHRSILPENLHFDKDLHIKLTHFNSAADLTSGSLPADCDSVVDYLAPEILTCVGSNSTHTTIGASDKEDNIQMFPFGSEYSSTASKMPPLKKKVGYDQKVDIWAVGCLLFELLTGKGPFEVADKELTCALILWGEIQHFPEKLSQPCVSFIQACLVKDPKARPSAEQLLQHEWLVKEVQAEAAGVPEGVEFRVDDRPASQSSSSWLTRQMTKFKKKSNMTGPVNSNSDATSTGTHNGLGLHLPRLCQRQAADIEMGNKGGLQSYAKMFDN